jgi:hypothetical protein
MKNLVNKKNLLTNSIDYKIEKLHSDRIDMKKAVYIFILI